MWFGKIVLSIQKTVNPLVRGVNNAGVFILALMMFLTVTDVTMRYFFNKPLLGSYEITEFMMALLAAFTIGYAAITNAHVNVDLLVSKLPVRVQGFVNIFTNLVCAVLFALISWRMIYQSSVLHEAGSMSGALSIPEYPFVLVMGIGFGVTGLVFLLHLLESIEKAAGKWNH